MSEQLVLNGKHVLVSALSGNFKMEPFENVSKLISKADKIKLKKAICFYCHEKAAFSLRTIPSDEEVLIGAADKYRPTCRSCHINNNCKSA
jgi:thymidine kinase